MFACMHYILHYTKDWESHLGAHERIIGLPHACHHMVAEPKFKILNQAPNPQQHADYAKNKWQRW